MKCRQLCNAAHAVSVVLAVRRVEDSRTLMQVCAPSHLANSKVAVYSSNVMAAEPGEKYFGCITESLGILSCTEPIKLTIPPRDWDQPTASHCSILQKWGHGIKITLVIQSDCTPSPLFLSLQSNSFTKQSHQAHQRHNQRLSCGGVGWQKGRQLPGYMQGMM